MVWNPVVYNKFKNERFSPFRDLVNLVQTKPGIAIIDLGCGTGELTKKLAEHMPDATVLGIDSSKEMLQETRAFAGEGLAFECCTIEEKIDSGKTWDLVFSHAAIQWLANHAALLPRLISLLNKGGQLAIQIPSNHDHFTHTLLHDTASSEPFCKALNGWTRFSPVLATEAYAKIFFDCGSTDMTVYEKVYPHVLKNAHALYEWVSGTAMIPYMERLPLNLRQSFTDAYQKRLAEKYTGSPVFYPFKRIIMAASF
ncbi:MAG: methyltransferase domain-containing protein [Bacteroidota bacterium]